MEFILKLKDYEGRCHFHFHSQFTDESTLNDVKRKIQTVTHIAPEFQEIYVDDERIQAFGDSRLRTLGWKYGSELVIKHSFLLKWKDYLLKMEEFREAQDDQDKQQKAVEANQKATELSNASFFSAYLEFDTDWLRMRREYAIHLVNIPADIKLAAEPFFERKFEGKQIQIGYEKKPSGTRSGAVCIVKYENTRRVFYLKANHNASSFASAHRNPLDMVELYVYKVLDVLGVGAKVEFVRNVVGSENIVYICGEQIQGFKTLMEWEKDWDDFERRTSTKTVNVQHALIQLSCLAQLLGLDDLNAENVGFDEETFAIFVVDFLIGFIDDSVPFESINSPKNFMSMIAELKWNLGRFVDLVKGIEFEEQLAIAKQYIEQSDLSAKLDEAYKKLEAERQVLHVSDLTFREEMEIVKEYISIVREKMNAIIDL